MFTCTICQESYSVLPDYCDSTLACADDMGASFTDENGFAVARKGFECICGNGCENVFDSSDICFDHFEETH